MPHNRQNTPDQKYRDQIATDLDVTLLVEAAAGTGKTTCLIARMVGLLREGKCRIETLAAVTFTRKAAAELRSRFQLALEKAAGESSGQELERLGESLRHVERCFIGTIHAFCGRLLRERPVEAGVDPGFVELDEPVDARLRQQAWREHISALIAGNSTILPELEALGLKVSPSTRRTPSLVTELDELGLEPAELGPAFLRFAEYADVEEWPAPNVPLADLKPCIEELREYVEHIRSLNLPQDFGNDELIPRWQLVAKMVQRLDLEKPCELMEVLEQFTPRKIIQKCWPGLKAQAVAEKQRWDDFIQNYAVPLLLNWREHRYEPVMRVIRPARDVYDQLRRERNGLNFQDLLLLSVKLLRDKPDVRRYFRERFTHLLVDEFQDTDPIQAEVMLLLTADENAESQWQRCRPVPGSLFVVGDPKQSIYRFRRADIVTYNRVREIIETVGQVIPLSANFRSIQPVVDWVNGCFGTIFPAQADDYSPVNRPLDLGRPDGADQESAIERLLIPAAATTILQVVGHEADIIARTIRRAIDEKWPVPRSEGERAHGLPDYAQAGDFMIVARRKANLTVFARKLQQYGLPHAITGGSLLNEVPELELLHTCLVAVTRSDDPVALVAALRSELFGIADTVLYDLRRHGGRFSYHAELPAGLPPADAVVLRDACGRLQTYSRWLRRMPAAAAIERVAADLGLIARACAAEEGDAHAGSLLKAIGLLRSGNGQLTAGDAVEALGRLVAQDELHDGVPVRPPTVMPVRVMNLHQCKGLEAPFVMLVDPAGDIDRSVDVHIDRSGDQPRGYLPIYGPKRGQWTPPPVLAQPPGWDKLASHEQEFRDAEESRLLYVAATRAGVKLVISQREGKPNDKNPWRVFDDFLHSAQPFADPGTVPPKSPVKVVISVDDWRCEVAAIEDRWRVVVEPTYAVLAIKKSALKPGPKPHGAEAGGAEWGQVLHTLLDAKMKQPNAELRGLALSALGSEELPLTLVDDVVLTVEQVIASELWRRGRGAQRFLAEVPVAMPVPAAKATCGLPTVLRGIIDLVFLEAKGWVIVDYKSERVEEADLAALVDYYRPQIEAYAEVWESIVGQPVVERGLFFTHTGRYIAV